jgi:predicted nucleic acid-binding protein
MVDTSVVVDLDLIPAELLPIRLSMSALVLAELAVGPLAADTDKERVERQDHINRAMGSINLLPFDADAAMAFAHIYEAVTRVGRQARGRRSVDLLIAAHALSLNLPLYTQNPDDFIGLEDLIEVIGV